MQATRGPEEATSDVGGRLTIDVNRLRQYAAAAGYPLLRSLAVALGITGPALAKWTHKKRRGHSPEFDARLKRISDLLKLENAHVLLRREAPRSVDALAGTSETFWRRFGIEANAVKNLDPDAKRIVTSLVESIKRRDAELRQDAAHQPVPLVDHVFQYFNPRENPKVLALVEEKAEELGRLARSATGSTRARIPIKGLEDAADKLGFVVRRNDLAKRHLLSFVKFGKKQDVIIVESRVPERTFRFELAKLLAWRLMTEPLVALGLLPPPNGELNFIDDKELFTRRVRHEIIARVAAAALIPRHALLEDLRTRRLDLIELARKYDTSVEVVVRRVVGLAELGVDRLPDFHFMKIDRAGNLIYKGGGHSSGVVTMRRGTGVCPKWAVVKAFESPLGVTMQWSVFPTDAKLGTLSGQRMFCAALVVNEDEPTFGIDGAQYSISIGCRADDAKKWMVYPQGCHTDSVEVGPACAICPRVNCNQRAARNPDLDQRYKRIKSSTFAFARKRRPWSPLTDGDLKFMEKVAADQRRRGDWD